MTQFLHFSWVKIYTVLATVSSYWSWEPGQLGSSWPQFVNLKNRSRDGLWKRKDREESRCEEHRVVRVQNDVHNDIIE